MSTAQQQLTNTAIQQQPQLIQMAASGGVSTAAAQQLQLQATDGKLMPFGGNIIISSTATTGNAGSGTTIFSTAPRQPVQSMMMNGTNGRLMASNGLRILPNSSAYSLQQHNSNLLQPKVEEPDMLDGTPSASSSSGSGGGVGRKTNKGVSARSIQKRQTTAQSAAAAVQQRITLGKWQCRFCVFVSIFELCAYFLFLFIF